MDRVKVLRTLISVTGVLLGCWLVLGGLELRIIGTYLDWHQQFPAIAYPEYLLRVKSLKFGNLTTLAWPMVVFGSSWGGALIGFWIGERWSVPAMILLAVLAIPFPFPGTLLGVFQLLLILSSLDLIKPETASNNGT
jgi:hypothetical protein